MTSLVSSKGDLASLVVGAEEEDLLFDFGLDGLETGLEKLAGIVAFFLVGSAGIGLAGGAVIDSRLGEDELAVGVDVDLGHAAFDRGADLVIGDAGAAMED